MNVLPRRRRSCTTRAVDLGTTADALDKFLFDDAPRVSASSSRRRSPSSPVRSGSRPASRSATSPARTTADGMWHVAGEGRARLARGLARPDGRLVPLRADPEPDRSRHRSRRRQASPAAPARPRPRPRRRPRRPRRPPRSSTPTVARRARRSSPPPATPTNSARHRRARGHARARSRSRSLVGAVVAFLGALAYAAWRRTRRRRHDPDNRRRVLGAWTEALERLAAAGIERRPSTTSLEFALRQAPALGAGAAGPAAHGPRAPAHRRDVLARRADRGRGRRSVVGGRRDRRRAAHERAAGPGAGGRAGARACAGRSTASRRPSRTDDRGLSPEP